MPFTHIIMAAHASTLLLHSLSQFTPTTKNCEVKFDTNSLQVDSAISGLCRDCKHEQVSLMLHRTWNTIHAKQNTEYKVSCYVEHGIQSIMLCRTWNTKYAMQNMEYNVSYSAEHGIQSIMLHRTWNTKYHAMQNMEYNVS